jgi:protein-S-isoprenylcysteine O-methyltransferase Ste14
MSKHRLLLEQIERQGKRLFRWRGQMGAALLPVLGMALWTPGFPAMDLSDGGLDRLSEFGLLISLCGLAMRWFTVGSVPAETSGRNTREQRAAALNTVGMYSIVRHPLYLANAVIVTGFVVAVGSLWFLLLFWLGYALAIERIIAAEEAFLRSLYGADYAAWVARTPLLVPTPALWQRSPLPFSARTVFRREYNGVFGVCLAFFVLEAVRDLLLGHQPLRVWLRDDSLWPAVLAMGLVVLAVFRTLKRRTRHLHVRGR